MKRKRIIASIITGIVVVAAVGAGMLYTQGYFGKSAKASATTSYQVVKLTTGDHRQQLAQRPNL